MHLMVYVRHPDETSLLVDELSELDEAIALCRDLVTVDGYERAEVWSEEGDRLYGLEREGAALRTLDAPTLPEPPSAPAVRAPARTNGRSGTRRPGRSPSPADLPASDVPADRTLPGDDARAGLPAVPGPAPRPTSAGRDTRILGERPDRPERWLGL